MNIDWSKAPEGATHYQHDDGGHWLASWIKKGESDVLMSMLDDGEDTKWGPGGLFSKKKSFLIPRPAPQWNGEGLPPVGIPVEWSEWLDGKYQVVTVLAYAGGDAWIQPDGKPSMIVGSPAGFRPIKTPAKIAAEERETAIEAIDALINSRMGSLNVRELAAAIHDAGYRKIEGGDL